MALATAQILPEPDLEGVRVSDLARRIAVELEAAVFMADDCQAAFGEALESGLTQPLALRLQALDALSQRLDDVSGLLRRLAELDGGGVVPLRLFAAMRLSAVSRRLTGGDHADPVELETEFW
jgi:hypothetical protein